jgi:hypothetical protein
MLVPLSPTSAESESHLISIMMGLLQKAGHVSLDDVGIVRCIEKLLIACASMSYDSCYDAL